MRASAHHVYSCALQCSERCPGAWPAPTQNVGSQAVASGFVTLFCALSCTTNMASELWGLYARVAITGYR